MNNMKLSIKNKKCQVFIVRTFSNLNKIHYLQKENKIHYDTIKKISYTKKNFTLAISKQDNIHIHIKYTFIPKKRGITYIPKNISLAPNIHKKKYIIHTVNTLLTFP